jgi:hypothetical protein
MPHNPDRLEALTSTPDESRAALIVAALKDRGIDAVAEGGLTSAFRAETFGEVKVMVHARDLDRARAALDEYKRAVQDIDWDNVDVGELE